MNNCLNLIDVTTLRWENKTTHDVGRAIDGGDPIIMPKSRFAIRVNQPFVPLYRADGTTIGRFAGTPEFKNMPNPVREDTIYVVSGVTAQLMRRWNFVSPRSDSEGLDRDASGHGIKYARAFVCYADNIPEWLHDCEG